MYHHHDLPWERPSLPPVAGIPPNPPHALHVAISRHAEATLVERGFPATAIPNTFDFDEPPGDREGTRRSFGFAAESIVLLQPTRAIPRKNVPAAVEFARAVQEATGREGGGRPVHLWITGPAEDGYDETFAGLVVGSPVPVTTGRAPRAADAYAAADLVVFPSAWEGFGNPVVESVVHRRPLVVAGYPALDELIELGLETLPIGEPQRALDWLRAPDAAMLERNVARLRPHLSLAGLPDRIASAFERRGWTRW